MIFDFLKRTHDVTLNRVHLTVRVHEGDDILTLRVNGDPARMVAGLNIVQARLKGLGENSTDSEALDAARLFAATLFGSDQAEKLIDFYHDNAGCVINVCGKIFSEHLSRLILKAQKKAK